MDRPAATSGREIGIAAGVFAFVLIAGALLWIAHGSEIFITLATAAWALCF
jgi:type IV secretory pathway TrbD component